MKTFASLAFAALSLTASLASASAADRQVTVYTGTGGITLPASALRPSLPAPQTAAPEAVPARKIRVVLASPFRATN